jgi:hypothetical protein
LGRLPAQGFRSSHKPANAHRHSKSLGGLGCGGEIHGHYPLQDFRVIQGNYLGQLHRSSSPVFAFWHCQDCPFDSEFSAIKYITKKNQGKIACIYKAYIASGPEQT